MLLSFTHWFLKIPHLALIMLWTELVVAPFGLSFTHLYPTYCIFSQLHFFLFSVIIFPPVRVQNVRSEVRTLVRSPIVANRK